MRIQSPPIFTRFPIVMRSLALMQGDDNPVSSPISITEVDCSKQILARILRYNGLNDSLLDITKFYSIFI